jgi:hypothetical protein
VGGFDGRRVLREMGADGGGVAFLEERHVRQRPCACDKRAGDRDGRRALRGFVGGGDLLRGGARDESEDGTRCCNIVDPDRSEDR